MANRLFFSVNKAGAALLLCLTVFSVDAQDCNRKNATGVDFNRFDINNDGTITDIESGLTWQRCAVGQRWNGKTCEGEAKKVAWQEAIALSKAASSGGDTSKNWRLPKLNELAGIVDIRCQSPRINLELFPQTLAKPFWTTNNTPAGKEEAYTLSFGKEGVQRNDKSEKHYARLVRGRN